MLALNLVENSFWENVLDNFFEDSHALDFRFQYPSVKVYEGNDEVLVQALVPGVSADDLNIELLDRSLLISGEKKRDSENEIFLKKERVFGKFSKTIKLPYEINADKVDVKFNDGILQIKLLKSEDAKAKKILIK